jgi:4-amino-4-deoxy-L-arabinose transferase-like glycosyltransferase
MKQKLTLAIIVFLGLVLRLYHLGQLPTILNRDEAALAYNGFLISETGQDEWEQKYPLMFKSFGDYKLPGYIYTLTGLFKLAQPTDFIVRLPSAVAGTGLIVMAYLYAKQLNLSSTGAMLASLLMAVSPIFIFYSRMAWEANLALFLFSISFYSLFFKQTLNRSGFHISDLVAVLISLMASLTYNTPWLYLPFLVMALIVIRGPKKIKKWLVPVLGLSLVFIFGLLKLSPVAAQKSGITIFTDETIWSQYASYRQSFSGIFQTILGNRYIYWLKLIGQNLIQSFSPAYLITQGGQHPWHNLPTHSHLYYLSYGLGLFGFNWILISNLRKIIKNNQLKDVDQKQLLLAIFLIISLAPAVVTVDAPHATRSLLFFFIFNILAIIGLKQLIKLANKELVLGLFFAILSLESAFYFKQYFVDYPQQQAMLKPGFDLVIQQLEEKFAQKEIAIVGDEYQYILAAWYLKLPPQQYFETNIRQDPDKIGLSYGEKVDNYHFIADKQDRPEAEKILVFWDNDSNQWQIERY